MEIAITIYLIAVPLLAAVRFYSWFRFGKLRLRTLFSRSDASQEVWATVLDWRIILWVYLLIYSGWIEKFTF